MEEALKADPVGLVEYVAKNLVKHPEDVQVISVAGPTSLIIELHLNHADLGAVIGKNGRIARSIRTLLNSISVKTVETDEGEEKSFSKIILEIIDQ